MTEHAALRALKRALLGIEQAVADSQADVARLTEQLQRAHERLEADRQGQIEIKCAIAGWERWYTS